MKRLVLAIVMALVAVAPCGAQSNAERLRSGLELQARLMSETTILSPQELPVPGEKSGVLAGVLSAFIFPGVGSYYAGNSGHGTRHLVIGLVTLGGTVGGLAACGDLPEGCRDGTEAGLWIAGVSAVAYLVNWIWSIPTATSDVSNYNRWLREQREKEAAGG